MQSGKAGIYEGYLIDISAIFSYLTKAGEYMNGRILSKKVLFRAFILLFMVDISVSVLSDGIALSYGLFGELKAFSTVERQESSILAKPFRINPGKVLKLIEKKAEQIARYSWLLLIVIILSVYCLRYFCPSFITPVALKVRMNN